MSPCRSTSLACAWRTRRVSRGVCGSYVPQNWFAPTNVWVVGQEATEPRGILLPNDLPAGVYRLTLRLYDPLTGAPAGSSAGEDVLLGELTIE